MSERVSTAGMHERAVSALVRQQAQLARLQNQLATGRRVGSPGDDPIAAVHIQELVRAQSESAQFGHNAAAAVNRLSLEEQTLADAGNLMQRIRELAVQANGGVLDLESRRMIAAELEGLGAQLVDLANRRDGAGEYLFAGYASTTQPFARSAAGVQYAGDAGVRLQQIAPGQYLADGHSGSAVFLDIGQGNGTFVTSARATNTGTGRIDTGSLANASAWVRGDYTLRFVAAGSWEILDGAAAVVASGAYVAGNSIEWNGARVTVSGQPAAGDAFDIRASGSEDLFTTLDRLLAVVRSPAATPAGRAQFATAMGGALVQLDRGIDHLLEVRAETGARLAALEAAENTRLDVELELESTLSELRDLDYAEAVSRMNQQYAGLQAAQAAYSRFAQLSLFDYL